jgi:hypothetical protein
MYRTVHMNEKKITRKYMSSSSSITWERPFKTGKRENSVQSLSACLYVCSLGPLLLSEVWYTVKNSRIFSLKSFRRFFVHILSRYFTGEYSNVKGHMYYV